jgi:hypothetical protein
MSIIVSSISISIYREYAEIQAKKQAKINANHEKEIVCRAIKSHLYNSLEEYIAPEDYAYEWAQITSEGPIYYEDRSQAEEVSKLYNEKIANDKKNFNKNLVEFIRNCK